jgi:protein phosphatase
MAVQTIQERVRTVRGETPDLFARPGTIEDSALPEVLREAIERACSTIYEAARQEPSLTGMGTTVTAAIVAEGAAFVAHVGDSRCYLARGSRIYQVSEDHSLVNEQLKAGAITPDEARHSRFKNIITRSVGFESDVAVDLIGIETQPGDRLVLCCDGLSNLVSDDEILQVVQAADIDDAPQQLIDLANARGGDDNISVVVVYVG